MNAPRGMAVKPCLPSTFSERVITNLEAFAYSDDAGTSTRYSNGLLSCNTVDHVLRTVFEQTDLLHVINVSFDLVW